MSRSKPSGDVGIAWLGLSGHVSLEKHSDRSLSRRWQCSEVVSLSLLSLVEGMEPLAMPVPRVALCPDSAVGLSSTKNFIKY